MLCGVELELLTTTNHAEWCAALQDACGIAEADWLLSGTDPTASMDDSSG